jgi:hypothetical protein
VHCSDLNVSRMCTIALFSRTSCSERSSRKVNQRHESMDMESPSIWCVATAAAILLVVDIWKGWEWQVNNCRNSSAFTRGKVSKCYSSRLLLQVSSSISCFILKEKIIHSHLIYSRNPCQIYKRTLIRTLVLEVAQRRQFIY